MSASEKLKALERGMDEGMVVIMDSGQARVVIDVLPQIVALAEAAEHLLMGNLEDHFFTDYRKALDVALAALNEQLEAVT